MTPVKLSMDDMQMIARYEQITGAAAMDVVIDDESDRIIIVVRQGQLASKCSVLYSFLLV